MTDLTQRQTAPTAQARPTRVMSRRTFLGALSVPVGAALLSACMTQSTAAPQPTAAAATGAITATGATTGTAATTSTIGITTTASTGQAPTAQIVEATNAFLATLDKTKRTAVSFPYPSDQKTATAANFGFRVGEQFGQAVWSNYPISDVIRPGLKLGDLTDAQRQAVLSILAITLSEQGYQKALNIMQADQLLSEGGTNYASGNANYVVGIFGTPSNSERWMLQFGGHHLAINATIQGTAMTLAPMLTGCQPATYTSQGQTIRPLGGETDKAFALINALDATQQKQAILTYAMSDLVLGPGHDGQVLQPEGIPAASLNADQQAQLLDLAGEWVNVLNAAAATVKMAEIKAHLAETYFAWSGPTTPDNPIYFRITGPTLHIEFANQGSLGGPGGGPGGGITGTMSSTLSSGLTGTLTNTMRDGLTDTLRSTVSGGSTGTLTNTISGGPGGGQQNPLETGGVNHIHTIYRDPTNEYGAGLS